MSQTNRATRRPSARGKRRQLAREVACGLCFGQMTKQDRKPYKLEDGRPTAAHQLCITRDAERRAQKAEATVAEMKAAAGRVQEQIVAAQRAQSMGLWLPGQQ